MEAVKQVNIVLTSSNSFAPTVSKIPENFQLNSMEIAPGKALKVNVSVPNTRLFVGNIPKSKSRDDIANEFDKLSGKEIVRFSRKSTSFIQAKILIKSVLISPEI